MDLTRKQSLALDYLEDKETQEVLFGGAAGPGKTGLGCYWQLKNRFKYPGSRGFIGRAVMKTLKDTTLKTFFEIAKMQGIKRGTHFDLTSPQDKENPNCVTFANGSLIFLRDLFLYPSDPDFDDLGSLEITDAFIDECGQVTHKAKETLLTRIRFGLDKWNLKPKILYATNPVKTWPYLEFYRPAKENRLSNDRKFVPALAIDNPYISQAYVDSLRKMSEGPQKQRLLYGNWEYDDDPATLIDYEKILDCFNDSNGDKRFSFITADIARFGSDKTVIGLWSGFTVKLYSYHGLSVSESAAKIDDLRQRHSISIAQIIADEDGVGGGVVDILKCKGFVNNSRPMSNPDKPDIDEKGNIKPENYNHLKSQCYFRLADRINKGDLRIICESEDIKADIIEELQWVKQDKMDNDGKRQVLSKDKVKEAIGRSPDYSDALMMREWFELSPRFVVSVA